MLGTVRGQDLLHSLTKILSNSCWRVARRVLFLYEEKEVGVKVFPFFCSLLCLCPLSGPWEAAAAKQVWWSGAYSIHALCDMQPDLILTTHSHCLFLFVIQVFIYFLHHDFQSVFYLPHGGVLYKKLSQKLHNIIYQKRRSVMTILALGPARRLL